MQRLSNFLSTPPKIKDAAVSIVTVAIRDHKNRVLVVRRPKTEENRPLEWECPGGHRDPGETLEEAAVREVQEEVGIAVHILPNRTYFTLREGGYGVMMLAVPLVKNFKLKLDEHDKAVWVPLNQIEQVKPAPPNFSDSVRAIMTKRQATQRGEKLKALRARRGECQECGKVACTHHSRSAEKDPYAWLLEKKEKEAKPVKETESRKPEPQTRKASSFRHVRNSQNMFDGVVNIDAPWQAMSGMPGLQAPDMKYTKGNQAPHEMDRYLKVPAKYGSGKNGGDVYTHILEALGKTKAIEEATITKINQGAYLIRTESPATSKKVEASLQRRVAVARVSPVSLRVAEMTLTVEPNKTETPEKTLQKDMQGKGQVTENPDGSLQIKTNDPEKALQATQGLVNKGMLQGAKARVEKTPAEYEAELGEAVDDERALVTDLTMATNQMGKEQAWEQVQKQLQKTYPGYNHADIRWAKDIFNYVRSKTARLHPRKP